MSENVHILLADDEEAVLRTTGRLLTQAGYTFEVARRAEELVQLFDAERFDAVLADIHFPDDHELGFLSRISDASGRPAAPVILMTGHPSLPTALHALRRGVVDYLQKPFRSHQLFECLARAVQQGRALRACLNAQAELEKLSRSLESVRAYVSSPGAINVGPLGVGEEPPGSETTEASAPSAGGLPPEFEGLSPRQLAVVQHLVAGKRTADIAKALGISPNTVRNHLKAVFTHLGIHSQVELLAIVHGRRRG